MEKLLSITYSEYVSVALAIQHAMRMRRGQMGGRTDMPKLTVAFRNFANAPKMIQLWVVKRNAAFTPCTNAVFFFLKRWIGNKNYSVDRHVNYGNVLRIRSNIYSMMNYCV